MYNKKKGLNGLGQIRDANFKVGDVGKKEEGRKARSRSTLRD
jgi:hypothetical protein